MTRENMINALVEQVDNWDMEYIIQLVKDTRKSHLEDLTDEQLKHLYQVDIGE
jgi:hypothetical protein